LVRSSIHLAIPIEMMRRVGFELEVGTPQIITWQEGGQTLEPMEHLVIDIPTTIRRPRWHERRMADALGW
jgi:GTP-binding protein